MFNEQLKKDIAEIKRKIGKPSDKKIYDSPFSLLTLTNTIESRLESLEESVGKLDTALEEIQQVLISAKVIKQLDCPAPDLTIESDWGFGTKVKRKFVVAKKGKK